MSQSSAALVNHDAPDLLPMCDN